MTANVRPIQKRKGFTLVEVLLALALTMLVLAATYSALILFQRVTVAGRADAERSQLARALERRITSDIRCVLFREQTPETQEADEPAAGLAAVDETVGAADDPGGTTDGSSSSAGTGSAAGGTSSSGGSSGSDESTAVAITAPADAYATQSVGVFGDATTLVLHVSKPSRPTAISVPTATPASTTMSGIAAPVVPRTTDLRSISYFLAVAGGGGLQGAVATSTPMTSAGTAGTTALGQAAQGLARLDGDRLAIQQADQAGGVDLLAQNATVLAPEVTELRFRYFDGMAWVETWDSVALNALPRAIEVTLRIDVDADEQQPVSFFNAAPPPAASDVYRFVVALPVADPTQGLAL